MTFIDIYNQTIYYSSVGDYSQVAYQIGRMIRKILDFDSMQRESLIKVVKGFDKVIRLMASGPDGMVVNTLEAIN